MECHKYDLFGGRTLHIAYFTGVTNSATLFKSVTEQLVDAALIDARLIVDPFQIDAAAARALLNDQTNSLTTKTLHSELVFNLSGTRNVAESFRRFGVTEKSDKIVLCVFDAQDEQLVAATALIEGTPAAIGSLGSHLEPGDFTLIKKYYKIQDLELKTSSLVDAIVSRIATKSCSK